MADISEHRTEHHHVGQPGHDGRVKIGIGHRRVGVDQGSEAADVPRRDGRPWRAPHHMVGPARRRRHPPGRGARPILAIRRSGSIRPAPRRHRARPPAHSCSANCASPRTRSARSARSRRAMSGAVGQPRRDRIAGRQPLQRPAQLGRPEGRRGYNPSNSTVPASATRTSASRSAAVGATTAPGHRHRVQGITPTHRTAPKPLARGRRSPGRRRPTRRRPPGGRRRPRPFRTETRPRQKAGTVRVHPVPPPELGLPQVTASLTPSSAHRAGGGNTEPRSPTDGTEFARRAKQAGGPASSARPGRRLPPRQPLAGNQEGGAPRAHSRAAGTRTATGRPTTVASSAGCRGPPCPPGSPHGDAATPPAARRGGRRGEAGPGRASAPRWNGDSAGSPRSARSAPPRWRSRTSRRAPGAVSAPADWQPPGEHPQVPQQRQRHATRGHRQRITRVHPRPVRRTRQPVDRLGEGCGWRHLASPGAAQPPPRAMALARTVPATQPVPHGLPCHWRANSRRSARARRSADSTSSERMASPARRTSAASAAARRTAPPSRARPRVAPRRRPRPAFRPRRPPGRGRRWHGHVRPRRADRGPPPQPRLAASPHNDGPRSSSAANNGRNSSAADAWRSAGTPTAVAAPGAPAGRNRSSTSRTLGTPPGCPPPAAPGRVGQSSRPGPSSLTQPPQGRHSVTRVDGRSPSIDRRCSMSRWTVRDVMTTDVVAGPRTRRTRRSWGRSPVTRLAPFPLSTASAGCSASSGGRPAAQDGVRRAGAAAAPAGAPAAAGGAGQGIE